MFAIWDHRGEAYRLVLSLFDWTASLLGLSVLDPIPYERFFKLFVVAVIILLSAIVFYGLSFQFYKKALMIALLFAIVFVNVSSSTVFAQPDHFGAMVATASTFLLFRNAKLHFFMAGFLAASIVGFKLPLIFVGAASILAGLALLRTKGIDLSRPIVFAFAGGLSSLAVYATYLLATPFGVQDTISLLGYQGTLNRSYPDRVLVFIELLRDMSIHIPMILAVAVALFPVVVQLFLRSHKNVEASGDLAVLLFWALSLVLTIFPLFLQSQRFPYHLMAIVPVTFLTFVGVILGLTVRLKTLYVSARTVSNLVAGLTLFLVVYPVDTTIHNSNIAFWSERIPQQKNDMELRDFVSENCLGPVLYLSTGGAAYAIGAESYLRQTYPLDIQRRGELQLIPRRNEIGNEILRFEGECIHWNQRWLNSASRPWFKIIENKILDEYVQSNNQPSIWVKVG